MQGRPTKTSTLNPIKTKDYYLYFKQALEHLYPKEDVSQDAKTLWEDFSKVVESLQKPKVEPVQKEPEKPKSRIKK